MPSFSDFSAELRLMVYSHIPVPAPQNNCLWELKNVKRTTPAILLTCKLVHNEVLSVWGSAWPPTYQLYIPQTLSFKPGPTFQRPGSSLPHPEAAAIEEWCTTVGRYITGRISSLQLVGARLPIPNTPRRTMNKWRPIEADRAAEKIDHVVKQLPKYFQGLKYIEIKLAGWPPMLWERGLVKLVDGIKSIESIKIKTSARDWALENGEMYLDQGVFDLAMHTGDFLMRRNKGQTKNLTMKERFDKVTGDPNKLLTIGKDPLSGNQEKPYDQFQQECSSCLLVPSPADSGRARVCTKCTLTTVMKTR